MPLTDSGVFREPPATAAGPAPATIQQCLRHTQRYGSRTDCDAGRKHPPLAARYLRLDQANGRAGILARPFACDPVHTSRERANPLNHRDLCTFRSVWHTRCTTSYRKIPNSSMCREVQRMAARPSAPAPAAAAPGRCTRRCRADSQEALAADRHRRRGAADMRWHRRLADAGAQCAEKDGQCRTTAALRAAALCTAGSAIRRQFRRRPAGCASCRSPRRS